jgi:ABC-type nitrate/sulfonate/bicarbonate transport system substrate-binding protein
MGNSAGSAAAGDSNQFGLVQFLTKWGATAALHNADGNLPMLAVLHGDLNYTSGPFAETVDLGLTLFGPNQVRTDYVLLANPKIHSLKELKGERIAVSTIGAPDNILLTVALKKAGLTRQDVTVSFSGSSSANLDALISGSIDATFVHLAALSVASNKFRVLGTGASLAPQLADSFMTATPGWLRTHAAMAEAIDLAWLAEAKLFNTSGPAWVTLANKYTAGTSTRAELSDNYKLLKQINGWPDNSSGFGLATARANYEFTKQLGPGQLVGAGTRPVGQLVDVTPWNKAVALFSQHMAAY